MGAGHIESPEAPTAQEVENGLLSAQMDGKGAGLEIQCTHVDNVILLTREEDGKVACDEEDEDDEEEGDDSEEAEEPKLVWRTAAEVSCKSLTDAVHIFKHFFPRYRSQVGKGKGKGKGKSFGSGWEV